MIYFMPPHRRRTAEIDPMSEEDEAYQSNPAIVFAHYAIAIATKKPDDIPLWRYRLMQCGWLISRTVAESPRPSEIRPAASEFVRAALAAREGDGPAYERHRLKLLEYGWSMEAHEA